MILNIYKRPDSCAAASGCHCAFSSELIPPYPENNPHAQKSHKTLDAIVPGLPP